MTILRYNNTILAILIFLISPNTIHDITAAMKIFAQKPTVHVS